MQAYTMHAILGLHRLYLFVFVCTGVCLKYTNNVFSPPHRMLGVAYVAFSHVSTLLSPHRYADIQHDSLATVDTPLKMKLCILDTILLRFKFLVLIIR